MLLCVFSTKVQKSVEHEENKKMILHEKPVWDLVNEGLQAFTNSKNNSTKDQLQELYKKHAVF